MTPIAASTLWKTLDGYKLSTGDCYSVNDLAIFNNEAFAEYFVDFTLDAPGYENVMVAQLGLVSYLSLYLHTDSGEFVGLARSAIRGNRIWVGGFAIVPAFRSKGVGSVLMREYLNLLRERSNARLVQLEVIKQNARAVKLYNRFGFRENYQLRDYAIHDIKVLPGPGSFVVSTSDQVDLTFPWLQQRVAYSWQREFTTLLTSCKAMKQTVVRKEGGEYLAAFAIETARQPIRIIGFAYETGGVTSQELASAIRLAVGDGCSGVQVHLEPEPSELIQLLEGMEGCAREPEFEEHHMILQLERAS